MSLKYDEYPRLRVPATLAAVPGPTYTSPSIPIKGAVQASFHLFATNGNIPSSYDLQVRRAGHGFITAIGAVGIGVVANVPGGTTPLNGPGAVVILSIDPLTPTLKSMPSWDEVRLIVNPHATLDITGFAVEAQVISDRDDGSGDKINNSPSS